MDPTLDLCLIRDSFSKMSLSDSNIPYMYIVTNDEMKTLIEMKPTFNKIVSRNKTSNLPPVNVNVEDYTRLSQLKDKFNNVDDNKFRKAREKANPFEKLGNGIFRNRAGLKMANIDAVFSLTGVYNLTSYQNKTSEPFSFFAGADAPGSFSEYVQFRRPISRGFGMSLTSGLKWDKSILDTKRFEILNGSDGTGDFFTNHSWLFSHIIGQQGTGVDFAMGDGGFDVKGKENSQEYLMIRLFITEAYSQIMCLKPGGHFVLKAYDTVTEVMGQMLFLIACCFKGGMNRFKPVTSRPANSECYIVCRDRRTNDEIKLIASYLRAIMKAYDETKGAYEFEKIFDFKNETYDRFITWLTQTNNEAVNSQLKAVTNILDLIDGKDITSVNKYDISKCMTLWKLPGSYELPRWLKAKEYVSETVTNEGNVGNYAYITLVMKGDKYVPGAAVLGQSFKKFSVGHPTYCMVTNDVSLPAQDLLGKIYDKVFIVPMIESKKRTKFATEFQENMYKSWIDASYTKWSFLNPDIYKDVKVPDKVVFVDSDALLRRNINRLFTLSTPACVFSSGYGRNVMDNGLYESYGKPRYGEVIPKSKIAFALNMNNKKRSKKESTYVLAGALTMQKPDKKMYNRMIEIIKDCELKDKPYGHFGVVSGHDEQMLGELMLELDHDPVHITPGYAWDAGRVGWVPNEADRAVIHYYGNQKPWFIPRVNHWKDTDEWWSVADIIIRQFPEHAKFFDVTPNK